MAHDPIRLITRVFPGRVSENGEVVEIAHFGEETHSVLWHMSKAEAVPSVLRSDLLQGLYESFDGADLFSSAFKLASVACNRWRGGVKITFTVKELAEECTGLGFKMAPKHIPFMYEAGMGYYTVSATSKSVAFWDQDSRERTTLFVNFEHILQTHLKALSKCQSRPGPDSEHPQH